MRKATPLFEAAPAVIGIPITQLTVEDLAKKDDGNPNPNPLQDFINHGAHGLEEVYEDIAHYRRIFQDMAKFFGGLKPTKIFNFVFDPRSVVAHPQNVALVPRPAPLNGYPISSLEADIDPKRSSGIW